MTRSSRPGVCVVLVLVAGCIERTETITVEADGTVIIELEFETDSEGEMYDGDAVPTLVGGWLVEERVELDEDDDPSYILIAEAVFPPEAALPGSFAAPRDVDGDLALQFPTSVTIEERPDGVYYHFHRKYPARAWAQIEALRQLLVDEKLKAVREKSQDEYTLDDRVLMLQAFADFEAAKMLTFAREAFLEVSPDAPQDGWLAVDAAMQAFKSQLDFRRIARLMEIEDERERDEALEGEAEDWEAKAQRRLKDALREFCHYGGRQMSDFLRRFERKRRFHEITADLGDDAFEITVNMPGELVGSNADDAARGRATWKFSGERFRDRDVELMASSRLAFE